MALQRDKITANAEKLVTKGKVQEAIKEYERLLDDNPNDVNTLNRVGDLWVRINRTDEAVKAYSRIADHYAKDGFFLKAIAIYKKINKLDPSKLDVYAKLADLYAKQGLAMEAKSQYQVLADYYTKHGDPAGALSIFKKIAELDPNSINTHVKLADLFSQANQTGEALKEYDRVGRMLLKRGMLEEAIQVFRKALKIDPSNVELVDSLVTSLLESRDFDNATRIIEQSLEANRGNPRLTALLGKTHLAKGDVPRARKVLEQGMALNQNDASIRESLADLYLRQGTPDEALKVMTPVIDGAAGRNGVEMLNRVLRIDQSHIPTLEKLVSVYTKLNEETNILASMNSLAEAHISRKDYNAAARVLQDLIKREPENAQHRKKLTFVEQQRGGAKAPPPPPPPPKKVQAGGPVEQLPAKEEVSFDQDAFAGEELSIDLDASEPMDMGPPPAAQAPKVSAKVDLSAMEGESEDLDFITEHMTEAEVFAKYGLADKAIEHLQSIIERSPRHVGAFERLLRIQVDEGDAEGVREAASRYIDLLRDMGENETADHVETELRADGYLGASREGAVQVESEEVETLSATDFEEEPAPAAEEVISIEDVTEAYPSEVSQDSMTFDTGPVTAATSEPLPEETAGGDVVFDSPTQYVPTERGERPVPALEPTAEELGEVDFYIQQGLFEDGRKKIASLMLRFPDNADVLSRDLKIEAGAKKAKAAKAPPPKEPPRKEPVPAAPPQAARPSAPAHSAPPPQKAPPRKEPPPPPPPPPPARTARMSASEIESELRSAIPEDEEEMAGAGPSLGKQRAPTVEEENLFADEEDFFDLAAELEEELEQEAQETMQIPEEEQSLEEIFKEFKKGVEQQLDSEDYETHYNLGIAYKEMGLVDEAIGEFQLAAKDPKRMVECCSMLGLCFLEKGMPQLSVKWYLKGLESTKLGDEEQLGLRYDLASAYAEMGELENAQKTFTEIYGVRSNYRDVAARLKELQNAPR